jgi:hypothetical protein
MTKPRKTYLNQEALRPVANTLWWPCLFPDDCCKMYIVEGMASDKPHGYFIVGVCDADDMYIRKEFDGLEIEEAKRLFERLTTLSLVEIPYLLSLGMQYD